MFTTRKIQLLGMAVLIAAASLVTISAIRPAATVDLSWPPRPDFSILVAPVAGNQAASDYFERHNDRAGTVDLSWPPRPDFSILAAPVAGNQAASDYYERHANIDQKLIIPVTGNQAASDYFERHNNRAGAMADTSDYSLRHPVLTQKTGANDSSDYFLRH